MGWNAGTYTKGNNATGGWVGDASLGIGIEAGRHDTQDNDFASGINNCLTLDGQNFPTQNLPMNAKKHTNVANASARNEYAAVGQVQDGDFIWLGTTGGTATAQTATATPAITAYKAGQKFRMKIGSGLGSTGSTATAHTLNVNSVGAKNLVNNEDATNPTLGTWVAGALMEVVYDGTNFVITNDPGGWLTWTPTITTTSGSVSSVVVSQALYRKIGKAVHIIYYVQFNTSSAGQLNITMPINTSAALVGQYITSVLAYNASVASNWVSTLTFNNAAGTFRVYSGLTTTNWGTLTGAQIAASYTYRGE